METKFTLAACRDAGLKSVAEARALAFVAQYEPGNRAMAEAHGIGLAYHLADRGLLESDSRQWTITPRGREILAKLLGGNCGKTV